MSMTTDPACPLCIDYRRVAEELRVENRNLAGRNRELLRRIESLRDCSAGGHIWVPLIGVVRWRCRACRVESSEPHMVREACAALVGEKGADPWQR